MSVTLSTFDGTTELVEADLGNVTDGNTWTNHTLVTPVPFIQPLKGTQVYKYASAATSIQEVVSEYGKNSVHTGIATATNQGTGTFPFMAIKISLIPHIKLITLSKFLSFVTINILAFGLWPETLKPV